MDYEKIKEAAQNYQDDSDPDSLEPSSKPW